MHHVSMSTCPLKMIRVSEGIEIDCSARGTGFLWLHEGQSFLITNWHNVTGVNADTGSLNGSFIPNGIVISLKLELENDGTKRLIKTHDFKVDLYSAEKPLWIEHKTGRQIDCIALPLDLSDFGYLANLPINTCDFQADLGAAVGMDCFIIGYPEGLEGNARTPIWKRGSIATEPDLNHTGKPMLLVDTASRRGMSGSPVIIRHDGIHMPTGELSGDSFVGQVENFLGIYSGRIGADELGVQLGRVWKASVITEILTAGREGVHPNDA